MYLCKLFITKIVEVIQFFLLFCLGNLKKLGILMRTVENMVECIHQSPSRIGIYNFDSKLNLKLWFCPITEFAWRIKFFLAKEINDWLLKICNQFKIYTIFLRFQLKVLYSHEFKRTLLIWKSTFCRKVTVHKDWKSPS